MISSNSLELTGQHVLVVGLGKSGRSAIDFCRRQGATVSVSDSSATKSADNEWLTTMGVDSEFGGHSREFCLRADLIFLSPGVPHDLPLFQEAQQKGIPVIGELALAPRYLKTPVIAVTGTNGKTTVTTLIGELMKAAGFQVFVGGNIGTPLTEYLMGRQEADWLVLEVSSFQLDAAGGFRPDIGLLLNISPDHLDRYANLEEYALAKLNLFARQHHCDVSIINQDDPDSVRLTAGMKSLRPGWTARRCLFFGKQINGRNGAEITGNTVRLKGDWLSDADDSYELKETALSQSPNLENAAAAIVAARAAGCKPADIKQGLSTFQPLNHRMTLAAEINGVRYINDSKATNIGAVQAALQGISAPVVLIAGGRDKGGDYRLMAEEVRTKVKAMLLIGEAKKLMASVFSPMTRVEELTSMAEAVQRAHELAVPGDVVLLSPACASFDMFSGYVERGQIFTELALGLQG
ncbi:MAG: UDP-N-acetylmuramoyl-L-alanine--D-glutamate ligase [Desulfobulbaceae bacterium]|nr:UDP-N-acetylmuramoyl-L-alanine--D-glutamate ligase [Desulfobulbaceae bacterium]